MRPCETYPRRRVLTTGHRSASVETMAPEVGLGLRPTVRLEFYSLGSSLYSSSPATGSTQPSTLCRPRTMNTTQSPTTPQPHRRHRTHIPLSLRSIAMKAVSPSPANRRPIPTSSQPLCRAVPASPSNANASYRFRCGGTSPLSSPRRPAVRRKPRARAGSITRGRTGVLVRDAYAISWGHGSGVADPGPDHRDATIALPWRTYRAGGHSARKAAR
jgi:hypothetical protein